MVKAHTHIALNAQQLQEKALQWAKERLKIKGVFFPLLDSKKSPEENHEAFLAYGQAEADLVREYLHQHHSSAKQSEEPKPTKHYKDWHDT